MVELALIACCFIIASRFRKAGEKGAAKYIGGVFLALLGAMAVGLLLFEASGTDDRRIVIISVLAGYIAAVIIAMRGLKKGNALLQNVADTRVGNTERELEKLKREMAELKRAASPAANWAPATPQINILTRYREGLSYLVQCGEFDEIKFRAFNQIIGNKFSEAEIEKQLKNAELMLGGMRDLEKTLRSSMIEAINTFEELEKQGIDLSKYNV